MSRPHTLTTGAFFTGLKSHLETVHHTTIILNPLLEGVCESEEPLITHHAIMALKQASLAALGPGNRNRGPQNVDSVCFANAITELVKQRQKAHKHSVAKCELVAQAFTVFGLSYQYYGDTTLPGSLATIGPSFCRSAEEHAAA